MKQKTLVIVESPGKIKKINSFLGSDYIVKASYGHCRDLNKKTMSIDIENNFKPLFVICEGKQRTIYELKNLVKDCKETILAMDMDREGSGIAEGLKDLLKLKNPKRIVFQEITKTAILNAIKNPTIINQNMVNAQLTRRLLDRLVGYKISPILWKQLKGGSSAGRVQSVTVKIIVDKENDINKHISSPYFKTTSLFKFKKLQFKGILNKGKQNYKFDNYDTAKQFIKSIDKNIICKVIDVNERKSNKKPSPPFITSTLQQDASTKLSFNVKKTMYVAQKLYEAGYITYMRTDSTNLSSQAIKECEKYIIKKWGQKYSKPTNYTKNKKGAQEAHEAIRPTKLNLDKIDKLDSDCKRLYNLIWKRTIASQMSNAIINIQTIKIDLLKNKKSILPKKCIFISTLETVDFEGFLILYNTQNNLLIKSEESTSDNEINNSKENIISKIKIKDTIKLIKLKISEEYTKLPYRYNEAGLIKFLEKNGIGRPSTYSSIITKIIDKKYVEIKNIDGIEKKSRIMFIDKKFKFNENEKKIIIGKEKNKIVPTNMGIKINEFMIQNFKPIMDINFTAQFEKSLDKIAIGKANWITVLNNYYQMFNPIVEQLLKESKHITDLNQTDILLGNNPETNLEIYIGCGKYGKYIKTLESKDKNKWKYISIKNISNDNITLDMAIELLKYPKYIGKIKKNKVFLNKGQYGLYLKIGNNNFSIKDTNIKEEDIDIKYAKKIFNKTDPYSLKTFIIKGKKINLKQGPFGYYLQIISKKNKTNISLGNNIDPDVYDIDDVLKIFAQRYGYYKSKKSKTL